MMEVIHHDPDHELHQLSDNDNFYTCDGCKQPGIAPPYRCEPCNINLHKLCMDSLNWPSSMKHHFFEAYYTFEFFSKIPRDETCCACAKPVTGFAYHCQKMGWSIHPCCYSLPSELKVDDHDHVITFKLFDGVVSDCFWCKKRELEGSVPGIPGWSYVSTCNKYNFHLYCATQILFEGFEKKAINNLRKSLKLSLQGLLQPSTPFPSHLEIRRRRNKQVMMMFAITNVVLEFVSAVLDQVSSSSSSSSVNRLQCALFGMLISFAALVTCTVELIFEGRKKKLIWRRRGTLPFPWYYYQAQRRKPFGTFKDFVGLACALCQSVVAVVSYSYLRRHTDNPLKISVFPIIFSFGLLFSQMLKNQDIKDKPTPDSESLA